MLERNIEGKQNMLDDYSQAQLDALQVQINAQNVRIEQLERRFQRLDNRFTIHLNDGVRPE